MANSIPVFMANGLPLFIDLGKDVDDITYSHCQARSVPAATARFAEAQRATLLLELHGSGIELWKDWGDERVYHWDAVITTRGPDELDPRGGSRLYASKAHSVARYATSSCWRKFNTHASSAAAVLAD